MPSNKRILLAKVLSEFGIKGQVKIVVFSDEPLNLEKYELIDQNDNAIVVRYTNKNKTPVKYQNGNPVMIATLNGATTRDAAEAQRKTEIYIERDQLHAAAKNEYYYADLIGMDVIHHENGEKIGKINSIDDHGAGTIVLIEFDKKAIKPKYLKEEYFAFKDEFFPEVDIDNNKITINLPDFAEIKIAENPNQEDQEDK
ncbi:MAG: 16S rRNA processing protein RimM [Rickettsiales bacterium]|nr:16S rRNA processing protein RimM [Rickettsiales bacterium]